MGKYIIETDETVAGNIQGYLGFPIEICGKRTWVKTDVKLIHYTEPDLDVIRKEAYDEGYGTAKHEKEENKESCQDCKFAKNPKVQEPCGRCSHSFYNFFRPKEQKKEEIKVGDEVVGIYTGGEETEPFVIIRKIPEIDPTYYFGIYSKSGEFCQGGLKLKRTGRHFPEIAEVLAKLKETES